MRSESNQHTSFITQNNYVGNIISTNAWRTFVKNNETISVHIIFRLNLVPVVGGFYVQMPIGKWN